MKVAIVTGGSRGIGKACALRLGKDGMCVAVNYNSSPDKAEEVVNEIKSYGGDAIAVQADVSTAEGAKKLVNETNKKWGRIDVLVNNAGIVKDEYLLMMTKDSVDKCLDLNVKGYLYCAQNAALKMFRKKSGKIINISSVSSVMALAGQTVYSTTKGAVNSMTQTMAKELAPYGITVNAVAPGFISTEMIDVLPPEKTEEYLKAIPMGRLGRSEEVANVVAMLASDNFSYMTGQVLVLDGGLSL